MNVAAETPGVDFAAQFTIPIFHAFGGPSADEIIARREARRASAARRTPSAASRVTVSKSSDATEIVIDGAYRLAQFAMGSTLLAVWAAVVYVLFRLDVPMSIPIVLAAAWLLSLYGLLDAFLGSSLIRIEASGITIRRSSLGMKFEDFIVSNLVASIEPRRNGTIGQLDFYDIQVKLKAGSPKSADAYLASRKDAETVAARIGEALSGRWH